MAGITNAEVLQMTNTVAGWAARWAAGWAAGAALVVGLFVFGFETDAAINKALPELSLGDRADVETAVFVYLPEVAMEPLFDGVLRAIQYPFPPVGRRGGWDGRLVRQIEAVQRVQGVPRLGGVAPAISPDELSVRSLDQFGKAIDIAILGRLRDGGTARTIRELFARAYGPPLG